MQFTQDIKKLMLVILIADGNERRTEMTTHETPTAPRNTEEQLVGQLHDAAIEYEGTRIQGLLCRAGDVLLQASYRHPSGFGSWQDLRGYLLDYNIIGNDDETCGLLEEAYDRWPNVQAHRTPVAAAEGGMVPPVVGTSGQKDGDA